MTSIAILKYRPSGFERSYFDSVGVGWQSTLTT